MNYRILSLIFKYQGDWNAARGYLEEALALAQEARNRVYLAICLLNLGGLALSIGDFDYALSLLGQCRKLVQNTPDDHLLSLCFLHIGEISRLQGKYDEAITYFEKSLAKARTDIRRAYDYWELANAEHLRNHWADARQYLFTTLNFLKVLKNNELWGYIISSAAYFAIGQQKAKQATVLFGWAVGWRKLKKYVLPPVYQSEFDRYLAQAREGLSESEFDAAWAEGQLMSQEQILAFAEEAVQ
jgi:tetratricopeptide (TPR) repeat protein